MKSLGIPLLTGVALAFCGTVDAMSTVDSWFDPQVEFLEIGTVVNGGVPTLKVYGPDASGVYGGLGGVGGLERLEIYGHINQVGLVQDFFGNVIGTITNNIVAWNPARFSSYGPVPNYQQSALSLDTSLAQSLGWRGKHIEAIGTFHWGARPYEPASGRFLEHDPVFDPANPSACGGDMLNNFDADGRFGKQSGGLEFPFSEYARNAEHEALLDDLYGPKVTTADILVGLVNFGESVISLPFTMAEGIGSDIDTAASGTYVNEYGVTMDASTTRRVWAGTMAAFTVLPVSDFAEGGFQAIRGFGGAVDSAFANKIAFANISDELDPLVGRQFGQIVAQNPVASAAYSRLQARGIDVVLDFGVPPSGVAGRAYPALGATRIYMQNNGSAQQAASTLVHESSHFDTLSRTPNLYNTQYDEFLAARRELLFNNNIRPTLTQRQEIWDTVQQAYPQLPVGRNPFGH